ncbi:MAG TPA: hypothetical protein VEJ43_09685 [Pseudolabrys sp.]|nr:hypothetical protein [Pseudolabrys sp.]
MPKEQQPSAAEQYTKLAAHLRAKARREESPTLRAEWEHLAQCYIDLAEQTERNHGADNVYHLHRAE